MIVKNWFELIKQAGIAPVVVHDEEQYPAELVRLCELVAAAEREACAKVCDAAEDTCNDCGIERDVYIWNRAAKYCAAAIRARGAAEAQGRAAKNLSGAMQELADMRVEVERLTSLRDAAEEREQAALRQLDRIRAISQENYDKLNGWMHACLAAEAQRDALLEFAEEVRRSGDTRLSSMAIANINRVKSGQVEALSATAEHMRGAAGTLGGAK